MAFKSKCKLKQSKSILSQSKDDAYWWQARKETERTARAGLIPSRALQERRILHERTHLDADNDNESKGNSKYLKNSLFP